VALDLLLQIKEGLTVTQKKESHTDSII